MERNPDKILHINSHLISNKTGASEMVKKGLCYVLDQLDFQNNRDERPPIRKHAKASSRKTKVAVWKGHLQRLQGKHLPDRNKQRFLYKNRLKHALVKTLRSGN